MYWQNLTQTIINCYQPRIENRQKSIVYKILRPTKCLQTFSNADLQKNVFVLSMYHTSSIQFSMFNRLILGRAIHPLRNILYIHLWICIIEFTICLQSHGSGLLTKIRFTTESHYVTRSVFTVVYNRYLKCVCLMKYVLAKLNLNSN